MIVKRVFDDEFNRLVDIYFDATKMLESDYQINSISTLKSMFDTSVIYGAYMNDEMIGFISYVLEDHYVFVNAMYVMFEYQHQGIGKKLLEEVNYYPEIYLKVRKNATWAYNFYKKFGFIDACELPEMMNESDSDYILFK